MVKINALMMDIYVPRSTEIRKLPGNRWVKFGGVEYLVWNIEGHDVSTTGLGRALEAATANWTDHANEEAWRIDESIGFYASGSMTLAELLEETGWGDKK